MLAVRIDCGDRSRKGTRHHLRQHVNPQGSLDTVVREEERAYLELILWPGMCIVERDVESRSVALIVEAQAYLEGRTENLPAGRIPTSDVSIRARGHTA